MATETYLENNKPIRILNGRKRIYINVSYEDFIQNPMKYINKYFSKCLTIHKDNVDDMKYLVEFTNGKQDILNKTRPNQDTKINNICLINYAKAFVNFKKGFYIGKPIKYVNNDNENDDAILYLLRYNSDIGKASKDIDIYENLLITGLAYTFTDFRKNEFNIENESPYEYIILDNDTTFCVYSSDIKHTKLFSCCISNVIINDKTVKHYTIYFDYKVLIFKEDGSNFKVVFQGNNPIKDPITEYSLNQFRMGAFEQEIIALNSLNKIRSNQLDSMEENINRFMVFENTDIDTIKENLTYFRQNRTIAVSSAGRDFQAKVYSVELDGSSENSSNDTYLDIKRDVYDNVGVPMPTSNTGQGVSGEAQVYGGGWENAQNIASLDTQYVMQFEKEDLKKLLYISNNKTNSKTTSLNANNIEIKYTINESNNIFTKAQAFKYLRDLYIPFEQSLEMTELTDDPYTIAKLSEENYKKEKESEINFEIEKEKQLKDINVQNT